MKMYCSLKCMMTEISLPNLYLNHVLLTAYIDLTMCHLNLLLPILTIMDKNRAWSAGFETLGSVTFVHDISHPHGRLNSIAKMYIFIKCFESLKVICSSASNKNGNIIQNQFRRCNIVGKLFSWKNKRLKGSPNLKRWLS